MDHPHPHPSPRRPMGTAARVAWIVVGVLALGALFTVSALGYAVHAVATSPMVRIQVQDHDTWNRGTGTRGARHDAGAGMHLDLQIPTAVVAAGLAAAPWVVPDETWREVQWELRSELDGISPRMRPVAAELLRQLSTLPDTTLVEVEDGADHVRVEKRGDELRVRVRSPEADVDVAVPLVLVERVAEFVEGV